jgi:hypothetical protein
VARKQGRQEVIANLRDLLTRYTIIGDYDNIPQEEILILLESEKQ